MQDRYQCPDCHKPLFEDSIHRCISRSMNIKTHAVCSDDRPEKSLIFQVHERLEKSDKATRSVSNF